MTSSTLSGLINNAALLLALGLIYDIVFFKQPSRKKLNQIVLGIILGILGIGVMMNGWELVPGMIFDTRAVLLCLTGLFFGVIPTVIAALMTGFYRLAIGGLGVVMGIGVIVTSGVVGLAWRHWRTKGLQDISALELYLLGIVTQMLMLLWVFSLPSFDALAVLAKISLPTMVIFPLGTLLLGMLILNRQKRIDTMIALMQSEEKYRNIFENAVEGFYRSTPGGRFVSVNPAFVKMFGYASAEELVSNHFDINTDFYVDAEIRKQWQQALSEKGYVKDFEFKAKRKDGSHFWASDSTRAIFAPNGNGLCYEGSVSDITKRKEAIESLRRNEALTKAVLENLPIGVAVNSIDPAVKFEFINDNFVKFYRTSKAALTTPDTFWESVYEDPEFRQKIRKQVLDDCASGDPERMYWQDIPITRKGAGTTYITARNIPLADKPLLISTVWDVTERKQMEAKLQNIQKMEAIGNLAGGIAHDFNNILSPIIGYAQLLMDEIPSESTDYECAQEIYVAGKRGSELVQQILAFSRQSENAVMPVHIQQVLKEALKLCRSTIPSDIEIIHDIQNDCRPVLADATQIHQIAMNLITNAYHAVETNSGKISVRLKETILAREDLADSGLAPGGYVVLTVSDTGSGIDPSIINRIFDPYFTTKGQGKGTGLGLAVVYGIVKEHGGDINVHSELEKGTTVNVSFPVVKRDPEIIGIEKAEKLVGGSERLLLVDDEEPIVRLEKQILENLGYAVTMRTSSIEALEAFKANPDGFDLVVTDMSMPNMTGDRLAEAVRSIRPDIAVIICTGFSERLGKERAEALGVKNILMKPVLRSDLARMVRSVLDASGAEPSSRMISSSHRTSLDEK